MLARIINELAGLDVSSEDEDYTENSEDEFGELQSASTPRESTTTTDTAHLTASSTTPPLPPRLTSSSSSSSLRQLQQQQNQQQRSPLEPPQSTTRTSRPNRWSTFIDGAKRVIDNLIDINEQSDSDTGVSERKERQQQIQPGATTAGFPTVRRGSSFPNSEVDLTVLGDTTGPTLLQRPHVEATTTPAADADASTSTLIPALPQLSEPSSLMEEHHIRSLIAEIPLRYRQSPWKLIYSTQRDGISMQTLLRNARGKAPTVLVVRDMGKAVFGAFCSEAWKVSSRYYGTGETFVFQLHPREVVWHWWWKKAAQQQNDFFMWGSQAAVAVGGAGGYALWLDSELATGISRNSITFGNDSLSSTEEFRIGAVELWWLE